MKKIPALFVLLAFLVILCTNLPGSRNTPCLAWAEEARSESSFSQAAMRKFYTEQCKSCHGETGKGDGRLSRIFIAHVGNLTDPKMWARTDEELLNIICKGKPPMPAYQSTLREEGCRAMVDYVRTLTPRH